MVTELRELLRDSTSHPPHDPGDLAAVLRGGRRRVRVRRGRILGGTALASAGVVAAGFVVWPSADPPDLAAAGVPRPEGSVLRLSDAEDAVDGRHYRELASWTNEDLDRDNGQYFDGVTDDGLVLFRDGPRADQLHPRFALLDARTGEKDWLPALDIGQSLTRPLELGRDRLVLLGAEGDGRVRLVVHAFDRGNGEWSTMRWPDLPAVEQPSGATLGPDGRLYVPVPTASGQPTDHGTDGETHRLWSASLTDPTDVRDEGLVVGEVAFTDDEMVWTDATNGGPGRVHVRDLGSGEDRSFDPGTGERCHLLDLGASGDRVVMSQHCGTYDGGVRDDRVQVLDTDGEQVVTVQGSGVESTFAGEGDVVTISSWEPGAVGTYAYDLETGRFLRLSESMSSWVTDGPAPDGFFLWNTPANDNSGMTEHAGELLP